MSKLPEFSDIIRAQSRLKGIVKVTPLEHTKSFSAMSGANVFMKLENMQSTGSFKVRGAYNKISCIDKKDLERGVVCASAGNHAQGVAYAARSMGVKATVFMPIFTPPLKVIATRSYGAEVVLIGDNFDDAAAAAKEFQKESQAVFIHAFDDSHIIAGQGTIGLEIFHQLEKINDVLVPIGGGGMIAGIAIALKEMNPDIRIIGVEAAGAPSMKLSMEKDSPQTLTSMQTIADGIAVKTPGKLTFEATKKYVDEIVTVDDTQIAHTAYLLLQRAKILAEPSGVVAIAAVMHRKCNLEGRNVVPIISGGNINMGILEQILEKGMMEEGLRARIAVLIPDMAGELKSIVSILEKIRANIYDIAHERSITTVPVGYVLVTITFNLQDTSQLDTIRKALDGKMKKYEILK
ncbi:MAG: threonine ammonia-lyase [Bacteroidetes bacterium]|nr:MAG: threonine ammonia-lyase [Bacteroidota bacterium]